MAKAKAKQVLSLRKLRVKDDRKKGNGKYE